MTTKIIPSFYANGGDLSKNIYNDEVNEFLASSSNIANQILKPTITNGRKNIGKVSFRSYHFFPISYCYHPRPVVVHHNHCRRKENDKKPKDSTRIIAGVVGAVLGGYALYKVGQSINHCRNTSEELEEIRDFKKDNVKAWKKETPGHEHLNKIEKIANAKKRIFKRIKTSAIANLALTVTLAVGGILLVLGAIFASSITMAVGGIIALGTIGGMLLKYGLKVSDKHQLNDAKIINQNINELRSAKEKIPFVWYKFN